MADKASLVSKINCSLRWHIGENIAPSYSIPYGGKPSYRIERQFHIGQSWGIHETTVGRIVRKIENILIQSGEFCLPGKKALHSAQTEWNILVVDVSESPIERPKKNNDLTTVASRNGTR
ncbi:transposase family protein [Leptolyngbya boryana]|uniref:transposase family protein n=1 Tax=Leptolyngbya boryana TaxID=1184 RepID=UPI00178C7ED3|nr:transposase family protein [Leptolyngbya boryana]